MLFFSCMNFTFTPFAFDLHITTCLYLSVISFHLSLPIFYRNSFGDRKHGKKYIVDSDRVYKNISSEGNKVEHYYQHIIISQLISFLLYADSTNAQKILDLFSPIIYGVENVMLKVIHDIYYLLH